MLWLLGDVVDVESEHGSKSSRIFERGLENAGRVMIKMNDASVRT